jgi:hypothetical protein
MDNNHTVDPCKECCANCKWFDDRPKFCRLNPPSIIEIEKNEKLIITSMFPSIQMPAIDYCSKFENKNLLNE